MKTDSQLRQDVLAEVKWDPSVHAAEIGVEARDGVVTLAEHVDSFPEKWNVEHAAQRVIGVKALAVEIDVNLPGSDKRTDADIARSAKNILEWTVSLPTDAVKVMVEGGWLTLSGEVDWQYQRQAAADGVRHLIGVVGVSNHIAIKPSVPIDSIKAGVESALERSSWPGHLHISVAVREGVVTLSGRVQSWPERERAANAAWSASGVRNVVNKIGLVY